MSYAVVSAAVTRGMPVPISSELDSRSEPGSSGGSGGCVARDERSYESGRRSVSVGARRGGRGPAAWRGFRAGGAGRLSVGSIESPSCCPESPGAADARWERV
jgi:hypothetical protein